MERTSLRITPFGGKASAYTVYTVRGKGDRNARDYTNQAHSFRRTAKAAPARASPAERAVAAAGACRRSDDRRRIGGIRRAVEGDGGEDRRVPGADGRHARIQDNLRHRAICRGERV